MREPQQSKTTPFRAKNQVRKAVGRKSAEKREPIATALSYIAMRCRFSGSLWATAHYLAKSQRASGKRCADDVEDIAAELGYSPQTIQRALYRLRALGVVKSEKVRHLRYHSITITADLIAEAEDDLRRFEVPFFVRPRRLSA